MARNPVIEETHPFAVGDDNIMPEEGYDEATLLAFGMIEPVLELVIESTHDENLAEKMDGKELKSLAGEICEMVGEDLQSRESWEKRLESGLVLFGISEEELEEGSEGRSNVTHPLLIEAAVQFQARAIEEVLPASGPVKTLCLGEKTDERMAQNQRVETYMNHHLMSEDEGYFEDTDQMLFHLSWSGSMFKKVYRDDEAEMNMSRTIPAKDFIVPYNAKSLEDTPRYTHSFDMHPNDVKIYQQAGIYLKTEMSEPGEKEASNLEKAAQDIDGLEPSSTQEDRTYQIYETYITLDVPIDQDVDEAGQPTGIARPYVVVIEKETETVLSIRRNWEEDDPKKRKIINFCHYKYMPGIGFYGFGLPHLIGGLARSATDTIRSLLESATFANFQGGFVAKDVHVKSGEYRLKPGVWQQAEATGEDLRNAFYTPPFKEPSGAMFNLLGLVQEMGQRFASTTEAMVGNADNRGPVGTTVALIEQGSKIYSAIHKRLHNAQGKEFKMLFALHQKHMPEEGYPYPVEGDEQTVMAADFDPNAVGVRPVSDPNIISQAQRIAQSQSLMQMYAQEPQMYDGRKIHARMLNDLRIPDYEDVLVSETPGVPMDIVSENMAAMLAKPIKVGAEQDHQAHMAGHMAFMMHEQFGGNPQVQQMLAPAMIAHMAEHLAMQYQSEMQQIGIPVQPVNLSAKQGEPFAPSDPQADAQISQMMPQALEQFKQASGIATPPPPPPEPSKAEIKMQEFQADMQIAQAKGQFELAKAQQLLQVEIQAAQAKHGLVMQTKTQDAQFESQRKQMNAQQDMKLKEGKHIIESKLKQQKGADESAIEEQVSVAEIFRDQDEFTAEERRKEKEFAAKQARDAEAFRRDEAQKEEAFDAQEARLTQGARARTEDASFKTVSDAKTKEKLANKKEKSDGSKGTKKESS